MKSFYPLTYPQKSIWNVERTFPNISINNIAGTLRFKEVFDFQLLTEAINLLIQNNDAVRVRFLIHNGEPVQTIAEYKHYQPGYFDLSQENNNEKFYDIERQLTETPFTIVNSDLFYLAVFKLPGETAIFFKFHHFIADAWSLKLITDKILDYYQCLKANVEIDKETAPSYLDFVAAEKKYLSSEQFLKNKAFWEMKVETIPEFIYLKNKPQHYSVKAKRISFSIPEDISRKINQYCNERGISIFTLFVAIFSIYINQTTSKDDIAFGTTVLNRSNHKEKNTIGMFVNTVPIRLNIEKPIDFDTYIGYIFSEWKNILRNLRYPNELIIKEFRQKNQVSGDFFDVTITYQNAVLTSIKGFNTVKGRWHPYGYQANSLNIHINDRESSNSYVVNLDYLIELFTAEEIKALYQHLLNLLTDALDNPNKPIETLQLLSENEKAELLYEFNNTLAPFVPENLYQLFESQAHNNPDQIALVYGDKQLTYRELNRKAIQLARILRNKGIKPDSVVGLLMSRSFEMFIGMLGILKAGGAYLPIDPESLNFPRDRVKYMLEDSNCRILLINVPFCRGITWDGEIIDINIIPDDLNSDDLVNVNHPQDLAYVIYTSGSTGKPKGVLIEHHSIVNTIKWRNRYYGFNSSDVLLQIPPYNFDSSVEDIFTFFSVGATIVILNQETRLDLSYLKNLLMKHKITHFLVTPLLYNSMLDGIADEMKRLSSVTVAGENFQISLVKKHFEKIPQVKLYNEYGPTENSVCATVYQFSESDAEVIIGKPISNCRCYVFNQDLNLLPAGITGELYLGGTGLARGYVNNPELTGEKFINAPGDAGRLYKTGDLVKWKADGNLRFIERIDNQIKIRGFRVELDEIKNVILNFPAIKDVVVIAREGRNSNILICAYLVAFQPISLPELKAFLSLHLPNYMIPSHYVFINNIPLTHNGKIDKERLPEVIETEKELVLPETEKEKNLVKAWKQVFKIDIGTTDDMFECGADSIGIMQVSNILADGNWIIAIQDFYQYHTIKELANHMRLSADSLGNPNK